MPLDGIVVNSLLDEFNNTIINGKIDKIYQPEKDELILLIRAGGKNRRLLLSADSSNPRAHFTNTTKVNPTTAPMFCMLLRKHLTGGRIINICQPEFERVLNFTIECYNELGDLTTKNLIIEIMGRHSNIILIDSDKKIIDSIKRIDETISRVRIVLPGIKYEDPPSQQKLNPLLCNPEEIFNILSSQSGDLMVHNCILKNFMGISPLIAKEISYTVTGNAKSYIGELNIEKIKTLSNEMYKLFQQINNKQFHPVMLKEKNNKVVDFSAINILQYDNLNVYKEESISKLLDTFYYMRDLQNRINQKTSGLLKIINTNLDRCNKKLKIQKQKLKEVENRQELKMYGDLIIANIYKIHEGMDNIEVENFYITPDDESLDFPIITVPLEPQLSASRNAQKYFKQYTKAKHASITVAKQMRLNKIEIKYLESIQTSIINAQSQQEIDEIREEITQQKYIKSKSNSKKKQKKLSYSKPMHFISSDNIDIYVGRNNRQNDHLTLKFAHNDDIWLHTKTIPGSHTIIRIKDFNNIKDFDDIPDNTLMQAAMLAAYFSKGRLSSNVAVDYTTVRNVKKPSGAKPGMVIYEDYKTIYVTPDENLIKNLKKL